MTSGRPKGRKQTLLVRPQWVEGGHYSNCPEGVESGHASCGQPIQLTIELTKTGALNGESLEWLFAASSAPARAPRSTR